MCAQAEMLNTISLLPSSLYEMSRSGIRPDTKRITAATAGYTHTALGIAITGISRFSESC